MAVSLDWKSIDRCLMGDAWIDSQIRAHIGVLCDEVGVRWGGTEGERRAAYYVADQFRQALNVEAAIEDFDLRAWDCTQATIAVIGDDEWKLDARSCLFCPSIDAAGTLIDVGYGMDHQLASLDVQGCQGAIALIDSGFEPFSEPVVLRQRLLALKRAGFRAAITTAATGGRRLADFSASDWHDENPHDVPLPTVQTSREDAARLRRLPAGTWVRVQVDAQTRLAKSWNSFADLPGSEWPQESLVVSAHHDTTTDSPGANDNATGVAVLLDTARVIKRLSDATGTLPGRSIRFVSFGAEEQKLQGSTAFVPQHYAAEPLPRLMLNLDELATGTMQGVVLQFPELRHLVQRQLDSMHEGFRCHVLSQLDSSGDMFPFTRVGIPSAFLWRWRFLERHPDASFGHSSSDTPDKIRIRELKEYVGNLARLLIRLSWVPPEEWPENRLQPVDIQQRLEEERGAVFRTM